MEEKLSDDELSDEIIELAIGIIPKMEIDYAKNGKQMIMTAYKQNTISQNEIHRIKTFCNYIKYVYNVYIVYSVTYQEDGCLFKIEADW